MDSHSRASPGETVTGCKEKVHRSLEEVSILTLMNTWQNPSLMVHEVWGTIDNHQVKTNLQPPGLPRPPAPLLLGSPWALSVLFMAGFEAVNGTSLWGMDMSRNGQVSSSTKPRDSWLCHKVSGTGKIVLAQASHLLHELCWELLPSRSGHLILSRSAGGHTAMARLTQCLPYVGTASIIYSDCLLLPTRTLS